MSFRLVDSQHAVLVTKTTICRFWKDAPVQKLEITFDYISATYLLKIINKMSQLNDNQLKKLNQSLICINKQYF